VAPSWKELRFDPGKKKTPTQQLKAYKPEAPRVEEAVRRKRGKQDGRMLAKNPLQDGTKMGGREREGLEQGGEERRKQKRRDWFSERHLLG